MKIGEDLNNLFKLYFTQLFDRKLKHLLKGIIFLKALLTNKCNQSYGNQILQQLNLSLSTN